MGSAAILPLAFGAGAVVVLSKTGVASDDRRTNQVNQPPGPSTQPSTALTLLQSQFGSNVSAIGGAGVPDVRLSGYYAENHTTWPRELEDKVRARVKAEYSQLSADAKRAVCKEIKSQFPDDEAIQQLDCEAGDYEKLIVAAAGAAGYAIGAYYFGPTGGAVGAAIGAVIGKSIADWSSEAWDDLSKDADKFFTEALAEGVDDIADYAEQKARSYFSW